MLSCEQAMDVLGELIDELPDGIFEKLNGGVQLMEEAKTNEDGTVTLGMYFRDSMGRHVELYYGSFVRLYGQMSDEDFRDKLRKTLHHELTHHVESMAGDRSLERWDERHAELYGFNGIEVHSILFIDDDCSALAPAAVAMFNAAKTGRAENVLVAAASAEQAAAVSDKAAKAALSLGVDIAGITSAEATRELAESFDIALCMTIRQADILSDRFQNLDERIMCLAEDDIEPPMFAAGWKKKLTRLQDAVLEVIDELNILDEL